MTLEEKLREAEEAYHALMLGQSAREITDQNGERVTFTATNAARLAAYIEYLKNQIAGRTARPAKVWF